MKDLNKILKDNNINPVKENNPLDNHFESPIDQLNDLFASFERIFAQSEETMKINKLSTGVVVKFKKSGGKVFVTTNTEKSFLPYKNSFLPLSSPVNKRL